MNKFRKFLLGLTVSAGVACLAGAAACAKAPKFYELTFEGAGLDYVLQGALAEFDDNGNQFVSGGTVKSGVEVSFTVSLGVNSTGTPTITANGKPVTPDENGVYKFVIKSDTVVSASGLGSIYNLKLLKTEEVLGSDGQYYDEERWISYVDESGRELDGDIKVEGGKPFKFKLNVSPYYEQKYTVSCGYEALQADENGFYTVEDLQADSEVSVAGLVLETPFYNRENCGNGTKDNPYKLSRPVDLYYLAVYSNQSDFYGNFYSSMYYELVADIDMQGEKLFVIGDGTGENVSATFSGNFNGNNHTISNFRLTDEVISQTDYSKQYLRSVGLFGYAVAGNDAPVVIKNLNLAGYTLETHPGEIVPIGDEDSRQSFAGALVGFGVGVQITGCSVDGTMITTNSYTQNSFIVSEGGMVGFLRAAYSDAVQWDSFVRASSANIRLEAHGSPYSIGGIVGYLESSSENAISQVYNCYSTGSVVGGIHTGGIVGTAALYTGVANCYSTAEVIANNDISINSGNLPELLKSVSAGGIVGYMDGESVVYGCYSANDYIGVDNSAASSLKKSVGDFIGERAAAGYATATSREALEIKNSKYVEGNPSRTFKSLGWSDAEWLIKDNGDLPKIKGISDTRTIVLTAKNAETGVVPRPGQSGKSGISIYNWYKANNSFDQYFTEVASGKRSWGYFFDEELTKRVPYGFVPVSDCVMYFGLADYSAIAGTYYFRDAKYSESGYLTLGADGRATLRNGGMNVSFEYIYDGENVEIYRTSLANLQYDWLTELNGDPINLKGTLQNGTLTLGGIATLLTSSGTEDFTLTAYKKLDGFVYGEYLADGSTYIFYENGTGVVVNAQSQTSTFTFTVDGESAELRLASGGVFNAVLTADGEVVSINSAAAGKTNVFKGVWTTSAISPVKFEFDGFNKVILTNYAVRTAATAGTEGTYTFDEDNANEAEITVGGRTYRATMYDDRLVIDGENYYLSDDFTGSWFMPAGNELIDIELSGVGLNGYGNAVISYSGSAVAQFMAQYSVISNAEGKIMTLFVGDRVYAELTYDAETYSASGVVLSRVYNAYIQSSTFYPYDTFKGTWVSNAVGATENMSSVTFNGKAWGDASVVIVNYADGTSRRGTYELENGAEGTMKVAGKTYGITLNEADKTVTVALTGAADGTLGTADSWHGVVLYDGDGNSYAFDGKSNLGSGTVIVSGGNQYPYVIESDGTVKVDGSALTAGEEGFTVTLGGDEVTLNFKSGFAGEWLVGGTNKALTIEEVNSEFVAKVTFEGVQTVCGFVFDPAKNVLTLTEQTSDGSVITTLSLRGAKEMSLSRKGGGVSVDKDCIKSADKDKWFGIYTAADGSSWQFDGLGGSVYGSGTAIFRSSATAEPENYNYKISSFGEPYIRIANLLFVEADANEENATLYSAEGSDKSYKTVAPDSYYGREGYALDASGERIWYYFNGRQGLYVKNGGDRELKYTYRIISSTVCELTDVQSGVKYNCLFSEAGVYIILDISEQDKVYTEVGGVKTTYALGCGRVMWRIDADGKYTQAYEYTKVSDTVLTLTDESGKVYDAVLSNTDDGTKMTVAEKSNG